LLHGSLGRLNLHHCAHFFANWVPLWISSLSHVCIKEAKVPTVMACFCMQTASQLEIAGFL
jgi:hypothetical protein